MNAYKRILSVVASVLLLAGTSASVLAQAQPSDTGNAAVTITTDTSTNYLAVAITDSIAFTNVPYSFSTQQTTGTLTVTATDTRGTAAGWHVTLDATDFMRDAATSFAIGNLDLLAGTVSGVPFQGVTGDPTGITQSSAAPVQKTGSSLTTNVLSAAIGHGAGQFALPMNGTLTIPGGSLAGEYHSIVTVAINAGP